MNTIRSDSISLPTLSASTISIQGTARAEPESTLVAKEVVQISDAARSLQAAPEENIYDPHQLNIFGEVVDAGALPVQVLGPDQFSRFTDVSSLKAQIKEDFNSQGVYVDDKYLDAFSKCVMNPYSPVGQVPPDMDLPSPPAGWVGYQPTKADTTITSQSSIISPVTRHTETLALANWKAFAEIDFRRS